MPASYKHAALIIVGHGSTLNPDSSTPTLRCADAIRERELFAEVTCAFWKEEPSMREVFYSVDSDLIFIVPNFISEGYFTREVLPRELRLDGPVTRRDGKTIIYCDPVGIHHSMTKLLLHRAEKAAPGVPRGETSLIIVGHGTSLNDQSRKAIESQVAFIREGGHGFAEVLDAYMEEAPLVNKWDEIATAPNVVVVPFFIADGLHSYQDIPVLLGIESEPAAAASQTEIFRHNPHQLRGRHLYYSSAVGTDALMVDVILDQVHDASAKYASDVGTQVTHDKFSQPLWPTDQSFTFGQVRVNPLTTGGWLLHHVEDASPVTAQNFDQTESAREIALQDDAGNFRALKTAPTLKHGWSLRLQTEHDFELALEFFYPGAPGLWRNFKYDTLQPVPLRQTLGRQTGMYRFANTISDDDAERMIACECDAKTKCLRRITWKLTDTQPLTSLSSDKQPRHELAQDNPDLICVEACTHLVSAAREIAKTNFASKNSAK